MGVSCDSRFANNAWAQSLGGVSFPLLSDFWPHGEVSSKFGAFNAQRGMPERALFIIDKQGVVRYIDVHDIGEQPDEAVLFEELAKMEGSKG